MESCTYVLQEDILADFTSTNDLIDIHKLYAIRELAQ